jgi:hypothetical protein
MPLPMPLLAAGHQDRPTANRSSLHAISLHPPIIAGRHGMGFPLVRKFLAVS